MPSSPGNTNSFTYTATDQHGNNSTATLSVLVSQTDSATAFLFNDTATTEIYTLSLHDALPIYDTTLTTFDHITAVSLVSGSSADGATVTLVSAGLHSDGTASPSFSYNPETSSQFEERKSVV